MNEMRIYVQVRSVYGNELVYPMDDTAKLFASLLCRKTFDPYQLAKIRMLGYSVIVVGERSLPAGY